MSKNYKDIKNKIDLKRNMRKRNFLLWRRKQNWLNNSYGFKFKFVGNRKPDKIFYAPKIFSLIENTNETLIFFNEIIQYVKMIRYEVDRNKNKAFSYIRLYRIDMKKVKILTADSLMYLLSIIDSTRVKLLPINWNGNFPEDKSSEQFLKESGYLDFMNTGIKNSINNSSNIHILKGKKSEFTDIDKNVFDIRKTIIDFMNSRFKFDSVVTSEMYNILTELIQNIDDHAYKSNSLFFQHNWYMFVKDIGNKIQFIFMDNGSGIPTTVKKGMFDKFLETINFVKDCDYLKHAVHGVKKMSETGLKNRGNGLPQLYFNYQKSILNNLVIISNKGYYKNDEIVELENNLIGSCFCWEIEKGDINGIKNS